ncbi:MAG: dTDP-4-dehydrorhamnose 3,5-epimerase [Rhodospirillaceae bacterium]|jgi:dTDP-4-dehydrorhamnose 3,5-epimerase|nr:dTDP-4-dehydrorhamnose 3,5-epimerase [Rhodospirillaceae bacterium]MBT5457026.1 dTDP-4-dehydrorhamnose 3,5-epimerase [Rhodospirillaceae bacterium]
MKVHQTDLPGVLLVEPASFGDDRGYFMETYNARRYGEQGLQGTFVQDGLSFSKRGVLRGLHLQNPNGQGKLTSVLQGEVFDVAVDVRQGSPHFGRWTGVSLSDRNKCQLYIPKGFAHGFTVVSESALFAYKCTDFYDPNSELIIAWNDPQISVQWPVDQPVLSDRDRDGTMLAEMDPARLPIFGEVPVP